MQSACRVDAKGRNPMFVADWRHARAVITRAAVAPRHVEKWSRWRRPGFLHEAGKHQRGLPAQRGALDVDCELNQLLTNARIDCHPRRAAALHERSRDHRNGGKADRNTYLQGVFEAVPHLRLPERSKRSTRSNDRRFKTVRTTTLWARDAQILPHR